MEHPDVIREIDSYNWESVEKGPYNNTQQLMKAMIRTNNPKTLRILREYINNYYGSLSMLSFLMAEILLKLLENPRLQNKEWVFKTLTALPLDNHRNLDLFKKVYCMLLRAMPMVQRFLSHHCVEYRIQAIHVLTLLRDHSNEVAHLFLKRLPLEKSPHVLCWLLRALTILFRHRGAALISNSIRQTTLSQAALLVKIRTPLVRLSAVALLIQILGSKTPESFLDILLESWTHLAVRKWDHSHITRNIIGEYDRALLPLGPIRAFTMSMRLAAASRTYRMAFAAFDLAWLHDMKDPLHGPDRRRLIFTAVQLFAMKSIIIGRTLWLPRGEFRLYLNKAGIETTPAALRQQLKHARIIDESEQFAQPTINLISYPTND